MGRLSEFNAEALGYLDALYATARRLTRDQAAAEDLVHDTYVKAFRHHRGFREGTNLRAWLLAILHNTFLNDVRRRKGSPVETDAEAADRQPAPGPSPEEALIARAQADEVDAALAALPEAYREAVWLRDAQDMSYAEIAGILQVPMGTVMSRIARGRRLLHDQIAARANLPIPNPVQGVKAKGT